MLETPPIPPRPCALCDHVRPLRLSHVVPQFCYRWQSRQHEFQADGTGLWLAEKGPVLPLLCAGCEAVFGADESTFAREVFHPLAGGGLIRVRYGPWLGRFIASVCWRLAEAHARQGPVCTSADHSPADLQLVRRAWKGFLRGRRDATMEPEWHLLPLTAAMGFLAQPETSVQTLTRIVTGVTDADGGPLVYARIGPVLLGGRMSAGGFSSSGGTRVCAEGWLKPRRLCPPDWLRQAAGAVV